MEIETREEEIQRDFCTYTHKQTHIHNNNKKKETIHLIVKTHERDLKKVSWEGLEGGKEGEIDIIRF